MKDVLSKLGLNEKTKKLLEDNLGKNIAEKAAQISSVADLKSVVLETMKKTPVKSLMGFALSQNIYEMSQGKTDIADKISSELMAQTGAGKKQLSLIPEKLESIGISSENFASVQEKIASSLVNLEDASKDGIQGSIYKTLIEMKRNDLKGQSKADIRDVILAIRSISQESAEEISKGLAGVSANTELFDSIKNYFKQSLFSDDEKKILQNNAAKREEEVLEILKASLIMDRKQLDEMLKQSRLLKVGAATNVAGALGSPGGLADMFGKGLGLAGLAGFGKKLLKFGGLFALGIDALEGIADPKLASNSVPARGLAAAITGGTNGTFTGNALKGAALGATIGSIIPVVGTALGALLGGAIGGAASYIDTKWLADSIDSSFVWIADLFSPEKWLGPEGYLKTIWNLPTLIDQWGDSLIEGVKTRLADALTWLTTPIVEIPVPDFLSNKNGNVGTSTETFDANGYSTGYTVEPDNTPATIQVDKSTAEIRAQEKELVMSANRQMSNMLTQNTVNSGNVSNVQVINKGSMDMDPSHSLLQRSSFGAM